MTPEFETKDDAGKSTIRIKGVALRGNELSKNQHLYMDEELKRAARTFVNKPVNINHDNKRNVGHVIWMEYDKDGRMEYIADINKEPYVTMLREKSTQIRGVSIQSKFMYIECAKCHKRFLSEEAWKTHMTKEEFIKDIPSEPHGMVGDALSLVLAPETTGADTTVEVMESQKNGFPMLVETVMASKQVTPSEPEHVSSPLTRDPFKDDETRFKKEEMVDPTLREGFYVVPQKTTMILQPKIPEVEKRIEQKLKLGEPCSPELKACVDDLIAQGHEESNAWAICRSKIGEAQLKEKPPAFTETDKLAELLDNAPEPYASAWKTLISIADRNVDASLDKVEEAEAKLREIKRTPIGEAVEKINQLTREKADLEQQIQNHDKTVNGTLTETENLRDIIKKRDKTIVEMENKIDTMERFHDFKGKAPSLKPSSPPITRDPLKEMTQAEARKSIEESQQKRGE